MHFCRDAFATILEEPGVLSDLLLNYFAPSKKLFSDLKITISKIIKGYK